MSATLIFVYNADSGIMNGLLDLAHKTVSPATYTCNLCAVTYGPLGMKRKWREFVLSLGRPVRFLHRDELTHEFGSSTEQLPAIFATNDGTLEVWMLAREMNGFADLDELIAGIKLRLAADAAVQSVQIGSITQTTNV